MSEETKICRDCGRELPVSHFYRYYGQVKAQYEPTCKDCRLARQKQNEMKRKMQQQTSIQFVPQNKPSEQQDPAILYAHIKHVTDDEILKEVARRGFHGELQYSKTVKV